MCDEKLFKLNLVLRKILKLWIDMLNVLYHIYFKSVCCLKILIAVKGEHEIAKF